MKSPLFWDVIAAWPRKSDMIMAAIPILRTCPISRMVPTIDDAIPRCCFSTADRTADVFGDEKKDIPIPSIANPEIIYGKDVVGPMKQNSRSPAAVMIMPAEATILGSIRSESRPARGEKAAIRSGWVIMMSPAYLGENPLTYCK